MHNPKTSRYSKNQNSKKRKAYQKLIAGCFNHSDKAIQKLLFSQFYSLSMGNRYGHGISNIQRFDLFFDSQ